MVRLYKTAIFVILLNKMNKPKYKLTIITNYKTFYSLIMHNYDRPMQSLQVMQF